MSGEAVRAHDKLVRLMEDDVRVRDWGLRIGTMVNSGRRLNGRLRVFDICSVNGFAHQRKPSADGRAEILCVVPRPL
jgi:hypothetical protein